MSKVKIEGNASGTGTLTISAPNTNTDRSLTLPDGAGEIFVGDITSSDLPTGSILQVVKSDAPSGIFSTTNSTPQDTGHSASITPSSSSNKILVIVSYNGHNSTAGRTFKAYLKRGTTQIDGQHLGDDTSGTLSMSNSLMILDSPSTTSSVTYTMFVGTDGVGTAYYNYSNSQGKDTIILMEIAG